MELDSLYQEVILDHYKRPLNKSLKGDGVGCSISQASTSVVSDLIRGRTINEALTIIEAFQAMIQSKGTDSGDEELLGDGVAFAGVSKFPARVKCALLGWMAVKDAISQATAQKQ